VQYREEGPVAFLSLNSPERLNALSPEMLADLGEAIDALEASEEARVGILHGNGRAFCAGFDVSRNRGTYRSVDTAPWSDRQRLHRFATTFLRLWECSKPIIAKVHGVCMAGGVQLPMCCDLVVR
jgi:enoyl-CoA hydratase